MVDGELILAFRLGANGQYVREHFSRIIAGGATLGTRGQGLGTTRTFLPKAS